jgi:DNA-directed RNA polymerase subunit M/transcription elongation factor TFIIS
MQQKKFIRNKEDFVCENCKTLVIGSGYTNHCPECLYSKHVDVYPGDRAESCGGLMEPISLIYKKGGYIINHRCLKCGYEKNNRADKSDKIEILLKRS